jgi:hypothetical protein
MVETKQQNRKTQKDRLKDIPLTPLLITEQGAAVVLGYGVQTLQTWRVKTPRRWTEETVKKALEEDGFLPPPFKKNGGSIRYDVDELKRWVKLLPQWGQLPAGTEESES